MAVKERFRIPERWADATGIIYTLLRDHAKAINASGSPTGGPIAISDVTGLQDALDARITGPLAIADISGLQAALDAKVASPVGIANVTGLQAVLDAKAAADHTHAGLPSIIKLTSDATTITGTGLQNVAGMGFTVSAGTYYLFEFRPVFTSSTETSGARFAVTCPASTFMNYTVRMPIAADGAGGEFQGWGTTSGDAVVGTAVQARNTRYQAEIVGMILPSANGTVQLQSASELAADRITIKQGSMARLIAY